MRMKRVCAEDEALLAPALQAASADAIKICRDARVAAPSASAGSFGAEKALAPSPWDTRSVFSEAACDRFYGEDYSAGKLPLQAGHGCFGYVGRGFYALQLRMLARIFGNENVLVVPLSDFKRVESRRSDVVQGQEVHGAQDGTETKAKAKAATTTFLSGDEAVRDTMSRVFHWLGLPPHTVEDAAPVRHPSAKTKMSTKKASGSGKKHDHIEGKTEVLERLRKIYATGNSELFDMIGRDLGWNDWAGRTSSVQER